MISSAPVDSAIADMPRGGPNASWLDRRLQTDALEYTDRYDIPDEVKQKVITALDRAGTLFKQHEKHARTALSVVTDVTDPRILELGAGHGKLSAKILESHPSATVTVSDLDAASVANIAAGPLGSHSRATTQVIDATAIDAPDNSYDLVVLTQAFHHLPPSTAQRAIAEATRVGKRFLVIDLRRPSPLGQLLTPILLAPAAVLIAGPKALWPCWHDGVISQLRAYTPSAFIALGKAVDPQMRIEFLPSGTQIGAPTTVVYERPDFTSPAGR